MAELSTLNRKAQLVAELQRARARISGNAEGLRHDADIPAHFRRSVGRHKSIWLAFAAIFGWLLARLPARKKKVLVDRRTQKELRAGDIKSAGLLLGAIRLLWPLAKPLVTAYITKKLTAKEIKEEVVEPVRNARKTA